MSDAQPNPESEEKDLIASAKLGVALRGLNKETVFIPPSVDETILAGVRPRLTGIRRRRARSRMVAGWTALAASVVVGAFVVQALFHRGPFAEHQRFARGDLNHDGTVDILDAFQLARELKQGGKPDPSLDFNGDGKVDAADVDVLAARAVSLEKAGPS